MVRQVAQLPDIKDMPKERIKEGQIPVTTEES